VVGEFRISYSRLGPTEIRVLAILLNTAMYFFGQQNFTIAVGTLKSFTFSAYDLAIGAITLLLFYFFITTALQETIRLSKANE
jgi:hypothetical protein